jgi:hypothetical protein
MAARTPSPRTGGFTLQTAIAEEEEMGWEEEEPGEREGRMEALSAGGETIKKECVIM